MYGYGKCTHVAQNMNIHAMVAKCGKLTSLLVVTAARLDALGALT